MGHRNIEDWLSVLAAARSAGAVDASRQSASFVRPWQAGRSPALRSRFWLRAAVPMAAAAAIALGFFLHGFPTQPVAIMAGSPSAGMAFSSTTSADQTAARSDDCNADGRVNGEDISCYVRQHTVSGGGSALQAEFFVRRLLGT